MFRVVVWTSIENSSKAALNELTKKLKYLKTPKITRLAATERYKSSFLYFASCCLFKANPIKKSTNELKAIRLKNLQSHQP